jgi:hypothetical protein
MAIYLLESRFPCRDGVFRENNTRVGTALASAFPRCGGASVHLRKHSRMVTWWQLPLGNTCVGHGWSCVCDACDLLRRRVWDYAEDSLSGTMHGSPFAGGSQVLQRGLLPREAALWGSFAAVLLALGVGVILQFGYHTGPWTLPLGIVGLVGVPFTRLSRRVGCAEDGANYGLHFVMDG